MQADIADLRAVLGDDALLTIPALKDPANLRRYLRESDSLRIMSMPSVFFSATRRLVDNHDLRAFAADRGWNVLPWAA